eukprot:SAG11_NODE_5476_length_1550_cov_1.572019_1_plen_93_part_00
MLTTVLTHIGNTVCKNIVSQYTLGTYLIHKKYAVRSAYGGCARLHVFRRYMKVVDVQQQYVDTPNADRKQKFGPSVVSLQTHVHIGCHAFHT